MDPHADLVRPRAGNRGFLQAQHVGRVRRSGGGAEFSWRGLDGTAGGKYSGRLMSRIRPGCSGTHPRRALVRALDAGPLPAIHMAKGPKCPAASSGEMDLSGHAQLLADGVGDLPERDPFVGHRVEGAALRAVLQTRAGRRAPRRAGAPRARGSGRRRRRRRHLSPARRPPASARSRAARPRHAPSVAAAPRWRARPFPRWQRPSAPRRGGTPG